jgi:hypothetical protein
MCSTVLIPQSTIEDNVGIMLTLERNKIILLIFPWHSHTLKIL